MESAGTLSALARQVLIGIDRTRPESAMPTATLVLLLEGLIDLAEPPHEKQLQQRMQAQHMARVMAAGQASADFSDG